MKRPPKLGEVCDHGSLRRRCETCDLADEVAALKALLRKVQWRGDGYVCVGCGAMHRDNCKPGCEVTAVL